MSTSSAAAPPAQPLFSIHPLQPEQYRPVAEPSNSSDALSPLIHHLVLEATDLIIDTASWPKGKVFNARNGHADGGAVQTRSRKSGMHGRAGKIGWHMRESTHPVQGAGITYDDFRTGLLTDHAKHEMEYIPGLISVREIEVLREGAASVTLNSYKLPIVTAVSLASGAEIQDRDFLELIITVDLPAHPAPFSPEHRAQIAALEAAELKIQPSSSSSTTASSSSSEGAPLRSFLVIQVPVLHPDAPEQKDFVRGAYASVEAVFEARGAAGSLETRWKMATQSDARGSIPLFLADSSIPGKIVEDVPEFVHWARAHREKGGGGVAAIAAPAAPAQE